jgi:hypothetical protein
MDPSPTLLPCGSESSPRRRFLLTFCTNPFPPLAFLHATFFISPISIPFLRFGDLIGAARSCLLCDSIPMFMRLGDTFREAGFHQFPTFHGPFRFPSAASCRPEAVLSRFGAAAPLYARIRSIPCAGIGSPPLIRISATSISPIIQR